VIAAVSASLVETFQFLPQLRGSGLRARLLLRDLAWWIEWRMLPLTTADVANGSSDGGALTAGGPTAQFPGPIERRYVIAVSAVSDCRSTVCLPIPGTISNQITRKGQFPRGVRVS
jgi:hypothetical protein